jgi:hypothetical protein
MAKDFITKEYFNELFKTVDGGYEFDLAEVFEASINCRESGKTFNKISKVAQQLGADGYSAINGKTLKNFIKSWSSDKGLSTTESFIMKAFLSLITEFESYERY